MPLRLLLASTLLLLGGCTPMCGGAAPASSPTPVASPVTSPLAADPSCGAEATSHSLNSNTGTSFNLINHAPVTLTLFWLSFQGQRVKYQDVPPGQTRHQGTYLTHPWVVADPAGRCIDLFLVPTATPIDVTVG